MPIWKNRSGKALAKMCMSVYLPRSAVRPTILSFSCAALTSACPNGADAVFCPGSAKDAIIADVFSFGLAAAVVLGASVVVLIRQPFLHIRR
jgi:hypothetical protein